MRSRSWRIWRLSHRGLLPRSSTPRNRTESAPRLRAALRCCGSLRHAPCAGRYRTTDGSSHFANHNRGYARRAHPRFLARESAAQATKGWRTILPTQTDESVRKSESFLAPLDDSTTLTKRNSIERTAVSAHFEFQVQLQL